MKQKENIEEFNIERLVGIFKTDSKSFGFVVPDDRKIKTDIFISKKNFKKAKNNQKVVVQITKKPTKTKKPEGKIVEVLGNINQAGIDMLSVIKEYDLPDRFPKQVIEEALSIRQKVDKKDIPNRMDLRDKDIFTIDNDTAKDLDDAVWVGRNSDGNYLLDVHIADVSYYVKEGSMLDKEAVYRGTSVYMFDRVIPMLPKELSNGICSLNAGEDRFTISVSIEIDAKGNVISSDIYKSIINVKERMTYTNVDKIIKETDKKILKRYEKYIYSFKLMAELADILKEKRNRAGSLDLDMPESDIILDEDGVAIDIKPYENTISGQIIEQFMITANEQVAEKFYWLEAPFMYRVHEVPDYDKIKELNKFLHNLGYKIRGDKDNIHPKSFAVVLEEVKGKPEQKVVSNLILRTLKVARYESENKGHFGLASKYYCHFTSPIRRYPDLFIHRVISNYIYSKYNIKEKDIEKFKAESEKYSVSSSQRERVAQKAERRAEEIKKAEYMQSKIGNIYDGVISSITAFGMFVELENTVEGLIRFENMENDYYNFDEEHKILVGEHTNKTYKIGDNVRIKVVEADKNSGRVGFALCVE